ncbi:MAG: ribonuclease P protein component [Candidatus Omnitrophica bacterium]|nr:ribonuclease P protein component [Candidatus Omnitrophota bacterium]
MTGRSPALLRLRPSMRMRDGREFLRIRAEGRRVARGCLVANWVELPPGSISRVGVITGRPLGNAVQRARARRLLREAFRLHQHDFRSPIAVVLVARSSILRRKLASAERDFLAIMQQANLLKSAG